MHQTLLVVVAGAACVSACGRAPAAAAFRVVDSAGVSIASSSAPRWKPGEGWRVDSLPLLDIGGTEGPPQAQFTEIAAALLLPDGGVVVAEYSDATLRFFDSAGKPIRTVGRRGKGPAEYENPVDILRAGDSIIVWDDQLRRLSVLSLDGEYARGLPMRFEAGRYSFRRLRGRWVNGDLLFAATNGVSSQLPIGVVRDTIALFRVSGDGLRDSLLGRWPWSETMAVTGPRFVSDIAVPYQKHGTMRWSDGGFRIGTADEARIDSYTEDGRLSRSVRWAAAATPVAGDELNSWRTRQLAPFDTIHNDLMTAFRTGYAKARFPDVRPPCRSFLVSAEGELLVERVPRWDADGSAAVWDVFNADGEWLGPVTLPIGAMPWAVRGDRLLAGWNDADGVGHVRLYRVVRRP
jgi:hypothetical protein